MSDLTVRIDLPNGGFIGPGKVMLLEAVARDGSISSAARAIAMSYRRAWLLIDELNQIFAEPVVTARHGGAGRGQAALTPMGERVVQVFRDLEAAAGRAVAEQLAALDLMSRLPADPPVSAPAQRRKRGVGGISRG